MSLALRHFSQRVLLAAGSALAVLVCCEAVLRLVHGGEDGPSQDEEQSQSQGLMRQEARTGWVPREGWREERVDGEGHLFVLRINSTGQRGGEVQARSPGLRRILFLGDSFTMATQVREEDTFAARVGAPAVASKSSTEGWRATEPIRNWPTTATSDALCSPTSSFLPSLWAMTSETIW